MQQMLGLSQGKRTAGSKMASTAMQTSRSSTNLFTMDYNLENDPIIKQRIFKMSNASSQADTLRKLQDHLPTSSCNEDLLQLQVVGTNVFESEKACALRLIERA